MSENDFDFLRPKKVIELEKTLELKIKEIEDRYKDYFNNKNSPINNNHPDSIYNYLSVSSYKNGLRLNWLRKDQLDENIANLIDQAYREVLESLDNP